MGEETDVARIHRMLRGLLPMAGVLRAQARDENAADGDFRQLSEHLASHLSVVIDLVGLKGGVIAPRWKRVELGPVVERWYRTAQAVYSTLDLTLALPQDSVLVKVEPRRLDQILEVMLALDGAQDEQASVQVRAHQGRAFVEVVTPRPYWSKDVLERSLAPFATEGLPNPIDEVTALSLARAHQLASAMEGRLTLTVDDDAFRVHLSLRLV